MSSDQSSRPIWHLPRPGQISPCGSDGSGWSFPASGSAHPAWPESHAAWAPSWGVHLVGSSLHTHATLPALHQVVNLQDSASDRNEEPNVLSKGMTCIAICRREGMHPEKQGSPLEKMRVELQILPSGDIAALGVASFNKSLVGIIGPGAGQDLLDMLPFIMELCRLCMRTLAREPLLRLLLSSSFAPVPLLLSCRSKGHFWSIPWQTMHRSKEELCLQAISCRIMHINACKASSKCCKN